MANLATTITPKSDQLNADDLEGRTLTIVITGAKVQEGKSDEQPASLSFQDDNGKPFKPCKMMRRLIVKMWTGDTTLYTGRSMTLYRDPDVRFGKLAVGGIRISHMSHINGKQTIVLATSKAVHKEFTILPLGDYTPPPKPVTDKKTETDFPIYGGDGKVFKHAPDADQYRQWFLTNIPKLDTLEKVDAIQAKNIATFGDLNLKGFKEQIGDIKAEIANQKSKLQQPEETNDDNE